MTRGLLELMEVLGWFVLLPWTLFVFAPFGLARLVGHLLGAPG